MPCPSNRMYPPGNNSVCLWVSVCPSILRNALFSALPQQVLVDFHLSYFVCVAIYLLLTYTKGLVPSKQIEITSNVSVCVTGTEKANTNVDNSWRQEGD